MSDLPPPILVGKQAHDTYPAVELGNATSITPSGWSDLFTHQKANIVGAAGVSPTVLGVANQITSGLPTDPSAQVLLSIDDAGNLGISGAVSFNAPPFTGFTAAATTIGAAAGMPNSPAQLGSLYLRSDTAIGPRFFQYQYSPKPAWLPIPVGLNIFNVLDYGATGSSTVDATLAQQAAVNAAVAAGGGIIYYPPGKYPTNLSIAGVGPVIVSGTSVSLAFAGAGPASNLTCDQDADMFLVSGASNVTFRDLQFNGVGVVPLNPVPVSGAAVHFAGQGGQFSFLNVDISDTAYGIRAENPGAQGQIIGGKIKGTYVGTYLAAGADIHHTHINGGTYGLIMDGSSGARMFGVALFGALSLTMRNTIGAGEVNSLYAFDVEANYGDPPTGTAFATMIFPTEGLGASYLGANNSTLDLVNCWFQGGTVIGGTIGGINYAPSAVAINGGNFNVSSPDKYPTGSPGPISSNALDIFQGSNVSIGGANFGTGPNATGFGIYVHQPVGYISIVGNNLTNLHRDAAGGINILPSGGVNCQDNLIQLVGSNSASGGIFWPKTTSQPFIVANNTGFNPTGLTVFPPPTGSSVPWQLTNTYGVPGTFYINPSGATITNITAFDALSNTFNSTNQTRGGFHLEPGGQLQVTWHALLAFRPSAIFIGD